MKISVPNKIHFVGLNRLVLGYSDFVIPTLFSIPRPPVGWLLDDYFPGHDVQGFYDNQHQAQ